MNPIIIIPARLDSKRYPRKLIEHKVNGVPLIEHIFTRASQKFQTYVTCPYEDFDDFSKYIPEYRLITSSKGNINGTERVKEAALKIGLSDQNIVINVQGDSLGLPNLDFVSFYDLDNFIYSFYYINSGYSGNTKCVLDEQNGNALWFSRQDIKYTHFYRYHIGTYIYKLSMLRKLPAVENYESLEQNSWLANGFKMKMIPNNEKILSVDFPPS